MKQILVPLIFTIFVFQTAISNAQNHPSNIDISAGYSILGTFNLGSRFHYKKNQIIDLKLGTNLIPNKIYYSATLNHGWYFGAENQKVNQKMWSFNSSITLSFRNNDHREGYTSFASLFFAREFLVSKRLFVQPELGASIMIIDNTYIKDQFYGGYNIPIIPKVGLNVIYKL